MTCVAQASPCAAVPSTSGSQTATAGCLVASLPAPSDAAGPTWMGCRAGPCSPSLDRPRATGGFFDTLGPRRSASAVRCAQDQAVARRSRKCSCVSMGAELRVVAGRRRCRRGDSGCTRRRGPRAAWSDRWGRAQGVQVRPVRLRVGDPGCRPVQRPRPTRCAPPLA